MSFPPAAARPFCAGWSSLAAWPILFEPSGGGIQVQSGAALEVRGCAITGNTATGRGGGIYSDGATLTVINTRDRSQQRDRHDCPDYQRGRRTGGRTAAP